MHTPAPKPTPPTADVASCVDNHQEHICSLSNINNVLVGPCHPSERIWPAGLGVLAGQQLAVVAVDLQDLDTDCRVAVALGIPPAVVHYRRVDTGPVGHYDTAQDRESVMLPEFHYERDRRTEGWQGASPRNWRGTVPAFR